jgi:hypothetical protein
MEGFRTHRGVGGHTRPNNGRTNDWITPNYILEALGPFDLDPCACDPQPWPTAQRMYTCADNGLYKTWEGRIWLNPPYGADIGSWMALMAQHNHGTALVFARTETAWFVESVWGKASALLFLYGRLHFCYPTGQRAEANSGGPSVLIAYGAEDAEVLRTCGLPGSLVKEVSRPRPPTTWTWQ